LTDRNTCGKINANLMQEQSDRDLSPVNSTPHSEFGIMCRTLRIRKGLKQREVAAAIGVKNSTYGNVESSQWKVINRDRAAKLIGLYGLNPTMASQLLDAWDRCPISPGGQKRKEFWQKRNELRSKAKNHDPLKLALVELLGLHLMAVPDNEVCACDFGTVCGVCSALARVGIDPFTPADRDRILTQLVKIQEKMTAAPTPSA
jgi:transcriptional regulator with XRE-family HTH domain